MSANPTKCCDCRKSKRHYYRSNQSNEINTLELFHFLTFFGDLFDFQYGIFAFLSLAQGLLIDRQNHIHSTQKHGGNISYDQLMEHFFGNNFRYKMYNITEHDFSTHSVVRGCRLGDNLLRRATTYYPLLHIFVGIIHRNASPIH